MWLPVLGTCFVSPLKEKTKSRTPKVKTRNPSTGEKSFVNSITFRSSSLEKPFPEPLKMPLTVKAYEKVWTGDNPFAAFLLDSGSDEPERPD
jgi:hypothetical protein